MRFGLPARTSDPDTMTNRPTAEAIVRRAAKTCVEHSDSMSQKMSVLTFQLNALQKEDSPIGGLPLLLNDDGASSTHYANE